MTESATTAQAPAVPGTLPARPRAVLPVLCATQIISWGVLYYAFPVLLTDITADTGWSATEVTAVFSTALLVSAAVGIPVGRVLDARGPRTVMTAGSVVATVSLLLVAAAPNLVAFTAGWLAVGTAMAATLYQPAFAAVTRWWGEARIKALTIVTLAGGLASTVFAPLTAALASVLDWRATYAALALVLAVTIPAHALALNAPWPPATQPTAKSPVLDTRPVARSRPFLLLAGAMTLSGFTVFSVVIGLVPLMTEHGATAQTAAWALGLSGAGQTLGRALYLPLARRTGVTARTAILIVSGGATTAALGLVTGPLWFLVALSIAAGMVRGNITLLQATMVTDRWGTAHYGKLSALLTFPVTAVTATTPFATAALSRPLGGYANLFLALGLLSLLATVLGLLADHTKPTHPKVTRRREATSGR